MYDYQLLSFFLNKCMSWEDREKKMFLMSDVCVKWIKVLQYNILAIINKYTRDKKGKLCGLAVRLFLFFYLSGNFNLNFNDVYWTGLVNCMLLSKFIA